MKKIICPICGAENKANASFCKVCGSYLRKPAIEKEFEKIKSELKKFIDERIEEILYPKIIEMKTIFEKKNEKINKTLDKISENDDSKLEEFKKNFREEFKSLIENINILEINEEKIKSIDNIKKNLNANRNDLDKLSEKVSDLNKTFTQEINDLTCSLNEGVRNNKEYLMNYFKRIFGLKFDSILERIKKLEADQKKLNPFYKKLNECVENIETVRDDLENLKENVKSIHILSNSVKELESEKTEIDSLKNRINENEIILKNLTEEIPKIKQSFGKQISNVGTNLREVIEKNTKEMIDKFKQEFDLKLNSLSKTLENTVTQEEKLKIMDFVNNKANENEKRFTKLSKKISDIKINFGRIEEKLAKWEQTIDSSIEDLEDLKKKIRSLEYLHDKIKHIEKVNFALKNKYDENENKLNDIANEVASLKRMKKDLKKSLERGIENAFDNIKEGLRPKFISLSKQISKIKIDESKINNINSLEKKVEENVGKMNELTRFMNQIFEMTKNTPSEKAFHDSFSELKQEIFTLNEKMEEMRDKIKRTQKNTNIDYIRLGTELGNAENNIKKLDKRINLILKNIEKIRISPIKEVRKKYRELEKKIDNLENLINAKHSKQKHKKNRESKIKEIKDKIVNEAKNTTQMIENTVKPEPANINAEKKDLKAVKGKPEPKEKKNLFICKYCHKQFNNERLLELHEMVCEKRPSV